MNARRVSQVCALTITMAIFAQAAGAATTYYVKNGGDNTGEGTSDGKAWATIGKVNTEFNNGTFKAGDSILLKCGSKWAEQLVITQSGNNTGGTLNYITIGAYGSGARPIIGYDEVFSGWTATGGGYDDVYEISTSGFGEVYIVNETTTTGDASGYFRAYDRKQSIQGVEDQAGSSYWVGGGTNKLYVHAFDDTDLTTTLSKTLYGNTRGYHVDSDSNMELGAIRVNDESYITIQNIHAVNQGYGIGGMNTDNILVDDCRISGTWCATAFGHGTYGTTDSHDITVQNSEVRHNGNGLTFHEAYNLIARDNTLSDHWVRISGEDQAMMAFQRCSNVQAYDNDFKDGRNGIQAWSDLGVTREDFYLHHNRFHGVIDRAIWFVSDGSGDFGGDLHFYHNVIWLANGPGAVPQGFRLDAETASSDEPFLVYNNTIHGTHGLRMRLAREINLVLKNNLFYECVSHISDDAEAIQGDIHVRDFNFYYPVNSTYRIQWGGGAFRTVFGDYVDDTGDQEDDSFDLDPDFLNDPADKDDVKILASGEADNAGDNTGAPFNVSTGLDFYGLGIGGQASVGASEGVSSP